ncbi:MAG: hypothetical protein WD712_00500 [Candidatus Spechtbacterales bacterium]
MGGGVYVASILAFKKVEMEEDGIIKVKAQPAHTVKCFEADTNEDAVQIARQKALDLWPEEYGWFGHHVVVSDIDLFLDDIYEDDPKEH